MPQVEKEDYEFVKKALDDNYINEGELTNQFEKEIAELVGSKYAIATTSCTTAIFLALKALGIKQGDDVIVPDITFIATANAVDLCGAKPILVDINPETLTLDTGAFEKAITTKTKAVIPVHVSGRAADMESILAIAKRHDLYVVEDAAEALMSKHKGKYLGTLGVAGCFSFSANKTISTGQGGMIITDDDKLFSRLKPLKDQGRPQKGTGGDDRHDTIGYNFKFTNIQAALGLGQLQHLTERIERMKRNYQIYTENLQKIKEIKIFETNISGGEVPQWTDITLKQRDELAEYLKTHNIDCRKYWHPLHTQLAYKLPDNNFLNSTQMPPKALWLPSAFTLTDEDVLTVCRKIKDFFQIN